MKTLLLALHLPKPLAVLNLAAAALNTFYSNHPGLETIARGKQFDIIQASAGLVTALTSVLASGIIVYRIYSSTSINQTARKRYRHIIDIMIQSSAVYTLSNIAQSTCNFINTANITLLPIQAANLTAASNYVTAVTIFTTMSSHVILMHGMPNNYYAHFRSKISTRHLPRLSWLPDY